MNRNAVLLALVVAVATVGVVGTATAQDATESTPEANQSGSVEVGTGQQLSTVVAATTSELRADYEEREFEIEYESANESERATVLAERAESIEREARSIKEDYRNATRAYENGEISRSEYAQRIATLSARAQSVAESAERLAERSESESTTKIETSGLNQTEFQRVVSDLEDVSGPSQRALFERFTGERDGTVEIRSGDGLSIEVESEDGERSREIRRSQDDSTAMTVAQDDAAATARSALSTDAGNWTLVEASVHEESGYYEFEYALEAANRTGEAEVRVDGSSGAVFRIEEEIESREGEEDESEREEIERDDEAENETDGELSLTLASGTAAPGETVTVQTLRDGQPVAGVPIELNGTVVGETDENGELTLTLPSDEARIRADDGDGDAELEYEFDDDGDATETPEDDDSATETETADDDSATETETDDN